MHGPHTAHLLFQLKEMILIEKLLGWHSALELFSNLSLKTKRKTIGKLDWVDKEERRNQAFGWKALFERFCKELLVIMISYNGIDPPSVVTVTNELYVQRLQVAGEKQRSCFHKKNCADFESDRSRRDSGNFLLAEGL